MIDWQRMAELRDEVGEEEFEEVVALFLEEVAEVIERLKAAPDHSRLEEDLHFLKGSALNVGFAELGRLCAEGERQAAAGNPAEVDLHAIFACHADSHDALRKGPG